jgi:histone deacetylase 8
LTHDCPHFEGQIDYVRLCAGASLTAARRLCARQSLIAASWDGGRHHAKADRADGYCYVNDIVLAVLRLRETFARVLYIDLDCHHGDGVEEAFYSAASVFTLSLHCFAPGFYPGSGDAGSIGAGRGRNYCANVPLPRQTDDRTFYAAFRRSTTAVRDAFQPDCVVLQCGCDGLAHDPVGGLCLTSGCLARCVRRVRAWQLPMLVLGGGGYSSVDAVRIICV